MRAKFKYWRMEIAAGVCRLTADAPGASQNVLSAAAMGELDVVLGDIEDAAADALLIQSAKSAFIVGADVGEFSAIESSQQAADMLAIAHRVMNRLEALPMPSVAVIGGHCLGGGLELALACDYRVVCAQPSIRLGLPEVLLGIHPGFGGTARLVSAIGAPAAMDLMLSGRAITPRAAARLRVVDFTVPRRQLERTALHLIAQKPPRQRAGRWQKLVNLAPARAALASLLRKKLAARVDSKHYPAPYRLIDLWQQHGGDRRAMLGAEQASVAQLITTATSRNLVRVFFLREGLKKTAAPATPTKSNAKSSAAVARREFKHAHIIGAGVMGGDLAAWCALRGLRATLCDKNPQALAAAVQRAHQLFQRKLKSPRLIQHAMDRLAPDVAGHGARRADVIIEAVVENAEIKLGVLAQALKVARPQAIIATNTSSIPLSELSASLGESIGESMGESSGESAGETLSAQQRLVGLHFFNPVAKMQLVEVVRGDQTAAESVRAAAAFARRLNRLPVVVKSCPGFLVNRILMPYLLEAVDILGDGASAAMIDQAARRFGMPMGPIALADTVGLDICLQVARNMAANLEGGEPPALLRHKVESGKLGKKSGEGFYRWLNNKPQTGETEGDARTSSSIEQRLVFRFLNEAVACLREGIAASADDLDAAMIFGAGFAPFRGGPLHYIRQQGAAKALRDLTLLHEQYGARFKPDAGWGALVSPGG